MRRKAWCKEGDFVSLPIRDGCYGFGRVLMVDAPNILVGFYEMVSDKDTTDVSALARMQYILTLNTGDLGIKKKEWKVIGNIPLEEKVEIPLFWGTDLLTGQLYLRRYLADGNHSALSLARWDQVPATEAEILAKGAQPDGGHGHKAAATVLRKAIERRGLQSGGTCQ